MNKVRFFLICILLYFNAFSNNLETSSGEIVRGVKVFQMSISDEKLKILTVIIGKSRLSDIDDNVGTATRSTCLIGKDKTFLRFESSVMGGNEKIITSVKISSESNEKKIETKYCNVSDHVKSSMKIGGMKLLNLTRSKVISTFGKPSWKSNRLVIYNYEEPFLAKEGFTTNTLFEFYFKREKIYEIDISRITSN